MERSCSSSWTTYQSKLSCERNKPLISLNPLLFWAQLKKLTKYPVICSILPSLIHSSSGVRTRARCWAEAPRPVSWKVRAKSIGGFFCPLPEASRENRVLLTLLPNFSIFLPAQKGLSYSHTRTGIIPGSSVIEGRNFMA